MTDLDQLFVYKRLEFDYKELTLVTEADARNALVAADEYIAKTKDFLGI